MLSLFVTLMTFAAIAIPVVVVVMIVRRVSQVTQRLRDPGRLQQVFAESAAAALRRAGADPKAVAELEVLGMGQPGERGAVDLRAALQEARAALRKPDPGLPIRSVSPLLAQPAAPPRPSFD